MKIGILQTGKSHESLLYKFGDYPDLFKKFLSSEHFSVLMVVKPVFFSVHPNRFFKF